jgi:hypothetical protein
MVCYKDSFTYLFTYLLTYFAGTISICSVERIICVKTILVAGAKFREVIGKELLINKDAYTISKYANTFRKRLKNLCEDI